MQDWPPFILPSSQGQAEGVRFLGLATGAHGGLSAVLEAKQTPLQPRGRGCNRKRSSFRQKANFPHELQRGGVLAHEALLARLLRNAKLDFRVPTGAQGLGFPEVLGGQNRSPGEPATSGGREDHRSPGGASQLWAAARNPVPKYIHTQTVPHCLTVPTIFCRILKKEKYHKFLSSP